MKKLRVLHIIIIGAVACILVAGGLFYVFIKNDNKSLADENARYNKYAATGTQQEVDKAKADTEQAKLDVIAKLNELDTYYRAKMPQPPLDFRNRELGMLRLWREQSLDLGPILANWLKSTGVKDDGTSFAISAPSANPNDLPTDKIAPLPPISLGTFKVKGNFKQIMNHLRKWNNCSRLVMIDNPTLSGTSPDLQCEYSVTVFLFPKYPAPAETIPMAPASGSSSGAGAPGAPAAPGMPGAAPTPPPPAPGQR